MNKNMIWGLLGLAFIAGLGNADDLVPVAVSPGAENGPAVVRQSCPTFSWTAVSWAMTYKVVVFEAGEGEVPTYETIAANASPVLVMEIPGKASSWTPSADESLINGGSYVWYIGAMVNVAQGSWSEGRRFIIAENSAWGVVSEPREDGIGVGDSRHVLRDKGLEMTAAAEEHFNLKDDPTSQGLIDVEGTEGATNTFYGLAAGNKTMTGTNNSLFGRASGFAITDGSNNTFFGFYTGRYTTTGYDNTFLGFYAGVKTTTGHDNAFFGYKAGYTNTEGFHNTFVGVDAGDANSTGCFNTYLGAGAGDNNKTGSENVILGDWAGQFNVSGSRNVFIGNEAGSYETGSNKLYIDNSPTAAPLIYGDFSANILKFNGKVGISKTPTHMLDVGTSGAYCDGGAWVDGSSREYKENIEELTTAEAQQAFEKLEPVKFNYKANKEETYLGFIAEDVPDLVAMNDRKGLNPMDMVAMLTKVVQEQQKTLSLQEKAISELQEKITKLEEQSRKEK